MDRCGVEDMRVCEEQLVASLVVEVQGNEKERLLSINNIGDPVLISGRICAVKPYTVRCSEYMKITELNTSGADSPRVKRCDRSYAEPCVAIA